ITARSVSLSNAIINSGNKGRGNAGSLNINVPDDIEMSDTLISSTTTDGNAGGINIGAGHNVFLTNSGLYSNFFGQGSAGNITIHADGNISMENHAVLSTGFTGEGNPGSIVIDAGGNFSMTSGARMSASTSGRGNAGSVAIHTNGAVFLDSSQIFSTVQWIDDQRIGIGRGGRIFIDAQSLSLTNDAQLQTLVVGSANRLLEERSDAGDITIRVTNDVALASHSAISSAVEQGRVGDGGSIHITAGSLALSDNSQLTTDMSGQGNAGTITIGVDNQVLLTEQSAISTALNAGATGRGGSIDIKASSVDLTDSARINASTAGDGRAGDITISSDLLRVERGAQIRTATTSNGDAGNITLRESEGAVLSGDRTGVFANTEPNSTGQGGSILINAGQLQILDAAQVTLSSQGLGNAGNLDASVGNLLLDNQGKIILESSSGNGGNIALQSQDLLVLRHNSLISTSAGTAQAGGNGGNITIHAPFIIAVPEEDSDIRANAYTGQGGNINITTQGIYGLQFRPRQTPLSDITASSDFGVNGTVQINSAFDVTQGVTNLPTDLVDASNQINQACSPSGAEARKENRFVITGRGGLPPSPNEILQGESVITNWVTIDSQENNTNDSQENNTNNAAPQANPPGARPKPLVEAQGWVYGSDGKIILVAQVPRAIPTSSWESSPSCRELQVSPK
ncbi:MAG TPA: S-layer family protein, partial [Allocoleopsis sp.]